MHFVSQITLPPSEASRVTMRGFFNSLPGEELLVAVNVRNARDHPGDSAGGQFSRDGHGCRPARVIQKAKRLKNNPTEAVEVFLPASTYANIG
jgi:hypothetical protein